VPEPPHRAGHPGQDQIEAALGRRLGGTVRDLRRLSGGASRVTSSFDLDLDLDHADPDPDAVSVPDPDPTPTTGLHPPSEADSHSSTTRRRRLILQMDRTRADAPRGRSRMEAALLRAAADTGVPVPAVVAAAGGDTDAGGDTAAPDLDATDPLGPGWIVVERLEGETIPRRILRDERWAAARAALTAQCGQALAGIHAIDPGAIEGLAPADPFADPLPWLDLLHEVRPALELGVRWLDAHRPPARKRTTVHGDFRLGNLLVGPDGLRGVLDWELAHAGDPAEDLGWLSAPAWRFGGGREVGGFGTLPELLDAYGAASHEPVDADTVRWWQVYATVKWAIICALQASAHLSGATRSVELAAIGRRVCESEWDLMVLLGVTPPPPAGPVAADGAPAPFGRPTAAELAEAVREHFDRALGDQSRAGKSTGSDSTRFETRVVRNAVAVVERELRLGPAFAASHAERLAGLGFADDAALSAAIRTGALDDDWSNVAPVLAAWARDQLLVANPSYLPSEVRGSVTST
jgi:aminoglycoside phosphotransferase (APT) family kinase protein